MFCRNRRVRNTLNVQPLWIPMWARDVTDASESIEEITRLRECHRGLTGRLLRDLMNMQRGSIRHRGYSKFIDDIR